MHQIMLLALTFVVASRYSGMRARHRGTLVLASTVLFAASIFACAAFLTWMRRVTA